MKTCKIHPSTLQCLMCTKRVYFEQDIECKVCLMHRDTYEVLGVGVGLFKVPYAHLKKGDKVRKVRLKRICDVKEVQSEHKS